MEETTEKQVYELSFLLLPSIAEDKVGEAVEKLKKTIADAQGSIFAEEFPIKLDLAYTMSKTVGASRYVVNDAYIGWVKFEAEPGAIQGLTALVSKMDEVLRFLLVKAPRETTFTFAQAKEVLEQDTEAETPAPVEVVVE